MNLIEHLKEDVRFEESLKACMNCGVCTAICPAAEFYDYDPRRICDLVQRGATRYDIADSACRARRAARAATCRES